MPRRRRNNNDQSQVSNGEPPPGFQSTAAEGNGLNIADLFRNFRDWEGPTRHQSTISEDDGSNSDIHARQNESSVREQSACHRSGSSRCTFEILRDSQNESPVYMDLYNFAMSHVDLLNRYIASRQQQPDEHCQVASDLAERILVAYGLRQNAGNELGQRQGNNVNDNTSQPRSESTNQTSANRLPGGGNAPSMVEVCQRLNIIRWVTRNRTLPSSISRRLTHEANVLMRYANLNWQDVDDVPVSEEYERNLGEGITENHIPVSCVVRNEEKNGIEISFSVTPPQDIRNDLRLHNFKWHMQNRCWYARYSFDRWRKARSYASPPMPDSATPR